METFRWDLKSKSWKSREVTLVTLGGRRRPEQRNKASHETGAVMIQTVSKNSPYLAQTAQFFLYKNIPVHCPWLQQLPPILAEAETGSADGITWKGHTLRPVRAGGVHTSYLAPSIAKKKIKLIEQVLHITTHHKINTSLLMLREWPYSASSWEIYPPRL